jgi:hypothetical protein
LESGLGEKKGEGSKEMGRLWSSKDPDARYILVYLLDF